MLMRRDELVLLATEIKRKVVSGRFVFVLTVMTYFAWGVTSQALVFGANTNFDYNAWDIFIGLFGNTGNSLTSTVVFPFLLIFLLGSSIQEDVISGYSLVVQACLSRKNAYLWVKIIALLAVIGITIVALYFISLFLGVIRGLDLLPITLSPAGGHPDAWTIAIGAPPIYYSLPEGTNVILHGLLTAAYFIFAYFVVVMFVVGLTVRSKQVYTPLAFGILIFTSQFAVNFTSSESLRSFNLWTALTESSHRQIPVAYTDVPYVAWSHSFMLLMTLLVVGLLAAVLLTPTRIKGSTAKRNRGLLEQPPVKGTLMILLFCTATMFSGCNSMLPRGVGYEQLILAPVTQVPEVELDQLSEQDLDYLKSLAKKTVALSDALTEVQNLFGKKHLHTSQVEIKLLLKESLSQIKDEIAEIKSLKIPLALVDWYRLQYEPGLNELKYVVDNLGALYDEGDHVGIRLCLNHLVIASDYFLAAGQTIAPFAPEEEKDAWPVREGDNSEQF